MNKLESMAYEVGETEDLRIIVDVVKKIQNLLYSLQNRLNTTLPKSTIHLHGIFEGMQVFELSQTDVLLWGLLTISLNLKEQKIVRSNTSRNSDRVNKVL
jgi:hypothetical protein